VAEEQEQADRERAELLDLARRLGLLGPGEPSVEDAVVALHGVLGRTPSLLALAYPGDAVGDLRQPNLPGTTTEYPSWRLPLADESGRPVLLDEVLGAPLAGRIAAALDRR
jgi:4-alpha-glucanotransferase